MRDETNDEIIDVLCPNEACGDGGQRTVIAKNADEWLIIEPTINRGQDGDQWWIECSVCGQRLSWSGELAEMVRP